MTDQTDLEAPSAPMPTFDEFRSWLLTQIELDGSDSTLAEIAPDDNLFELGIVNSFLMMELIFLVEEEFSIRVDVMDIDPEVFFTLSGLYAHIVSLRS